MWIIVHFSLVFFSVGHRHHSLVNGNFKQSVAFKFLLKSTHILFTFCDCQRGVVRCYRRAHGKTAAQFKVKVEVEEVKKIYSICAFFIILYHIAELLINFTFSIHLKNFISHFELFKF